MEVGRLIDNKMNLDPILAQLNTKKHALTDLNKKFRELSSNQISPRTIPVSKILNPLQKSFTPNLTPLFDESLNYGEIEATKAKQQRLENIGESYPIVDRMIDRTAGHIYKSSESEIAVAVSDPIIARFGKAPFHANLYGLTLTISSALVEIPVILGMDRKEQKVAKIGNFLITESAILELDGDTVVKSIPVDPQKSWDQFLQEDLGYLDPGSLQQLALADPDYLSRGDLTIEFLYVNELSPMIAQYATELVNVAPLFDETSSIPNGIKIVARQRVIIPQVKMSFDVLNAIALLDQELMSSIEINFDAQHFYNNPGLVMEGLRSFAKTSAKTQIQQMDEYSSISNKKKVTNDFMNIIDNLFNTVITPLYSSTIDNVGIEHVKKVMFQAFERAALEAVLLNIKEALGLEDFKSEDFASTINEFLQSLDTQEKNNLIGHITKTISPLFLFHVLESFFKNQANPRPNRQNMNFDQNAGTSIGWTREALVYAFIAPQFLFKAFAESDFDKNSFSFYDFVQNNPNNPWKSFIPTIFNDGGKMLEFKQIINNGAELSYNSDLSNRAIGDIVNLLVKDLLHMNFEVKNSRNENPLSLLNDIGVDTARSMKQVSVATILEGNFAANQQKEILVLPTKDNDLISATLPISKIATLHKREDYRNHAGLNKGDLYEEFYEGVAKLINEEGFSTYGGLLTLLNKKSTKDSVENIAKDVFKKKFTDTQVSEAISSFSSYSNYLKLTRVDAYGNLKIYKDFTSWLYKPNSENAKLKILDLPSYVDFEVIGGIKVDLSYENSNQEFDTGIMLLSDDTGKLGIIRGD